MYPQGSSSWQKELKPRPCLIWKVEEGVVTVLAFSRFGGDNIFDHNYIFHGKLSSNYITKKLISIHSKTEFSNRRPIKVLTKDTYLIVIPHIIQDPISWKYSNEYISFDDLIYINEVLFQIASDEHIERKHLFASIIDSPQPAVHM